MTVDAPRAPLRTLATKIGSGVTPRGGSEVYTTQGPILIRSQNVNHNRLVLDDVARIPEVVHKRMNGSRVAANDVLLNITGASIGRSCVVPPGLGEANVNQHVCIIRCTEALSPGFLQLWLASAEGQRIIDRLSAGGSREGLNYQQIGGMRVPEWDRRRQDAIVAVADTFAAHIVAVHRAIDAKRTFKRGLMQQLLTGRKRFPEFNGRPWAMLRFDHLCEELSERNGPRLGADSVMGVIKGVGFEPMRDRVRGKGDLSRYKVVPPGAFAYNPMRLNIGSIAYNDLDRTILVSPDYEVFRARESVSDPEYVNQFRYSAYWSSFMERAGAGSVRVRIYFTDLARLRVPAPGIDEQSRIAEVLRLVDIEIEQLAQLHQLIESQRRALLSRLLSGSLTVP